MALVQSRDFDDAQLRRFTSLQRDVYNVLEAVARSLRPGETEREAARRLHRALKAALPVANYFHVPVALFGSRTAYPGAFGQLEARPTQRALVAGEPVILDCAPIIDGYTIDCSFAAPPANGGSDVARIFVEGDALLRRLRTFIVERAGGDGGPRGNMREIAREVDRIIVEAGFENCHRKHIAAVLGHRVLLTEPRLSRARVWGISPLTLSWFAAQTARSSRQQPEASPNWNHSRLCDAPLQPGIWAIEPHVAKDGIGLKFEELMLVTDDEVRYLDDDLPHVRRWAAAATA